MVELTDQDIDRALARGTEVQRTEPRAVAVRFDRAKREIALDLANGCRFSFPVALVPDLKDASFEALSDVQLAGTGTGVSFPQLDVDLSVPGLLNGLFGTRAWLARQAGSAKSPAKARAARENGKKGGRPIKEKGSSVTTPAE